MSIAGLSPFAQVDAVCGLLNLRHTPAARRPAPAAKPKIRQWAIYSNQHLALGLSKHVKLTTDEILVLQLALAELGFYDGEVDGQAGPRTRRAHERYRKSFYHRVSVAPVHPLAEAMVKAAETEARAGVKEEGGENRGKRVEEYQMVCGKQFIGASWCAAFVCWCLRQASQVEQMHSFSLPREAGAFRFEDWAVAGREQGVQLLDPTEVKARRGDIVIFEFSHIGVCTGDEEKSGIIPTVEGNTTPGKSTREQERNGGGVYARRRDKGEVRSLVRLGHRLAPEGGNANVAWA